MDSANEAAIREAAAACSGQPPAAVVVFRPDEALLSSLLDALDRHGRRIFVFVNGPASPAVEAIVSRPANVCVLRAAANIGLASGLNAVAAAAAGEGFQRLLLFDQDSTPEPELPSRLAGRFASLEADGLRLAVLGPLLVPPEGTRSLPTR